VTVVTVKEHTEIPISERFSAVLGAPSISSRHVAALDLFNRKLAKSGAKAFDLGLRSARTRQFCGVVSLGHESIEILPKIESAQSQEADATARLRLLRMLAAARKLPIHEAEVARLAEQEHTLLEVVLRQFCESALELVRAGLLHRYEGLEDNLHVVKGKLQFAEHVSRNHRRRDRVYCAYDEFVPDTTANRMIKAAARSVAALAILPRTQGMARELIYCLDEVSDVAVTHSSYAAIPKDRSTQRYEKVLKFAALILFGPYPDVTAGKETAVALLFDMNRLFEEYIGRHLLALGESLGILISLQGPRKWLGFVQGNGSPCFQLRPDVTLTCDDGRTRGIIDTKWKALDLNDVTGSVGEADVYQMLAYMTRYHCDRSTLLYPLPAAGADSGVLAELSVAGKRLFIAGIRLDDLSLVHRGLEGIARKVISP
jgi:5-methylcytosine-specific restriction enzyme subunit McrC